MHLDLFCRFGCGFVCQGPTIFLDEFIDRHVAVCICLTMVELFIDLNGYTSVSVHD